jgi:predicted dehydrogenase
MLVAGAAAAGPQILRAQTLGGGGATAPNSKLGIGIIGCGRQVAQAHARAFSDHPDVVVRAACDVDQSALGNVSRRFSDCFETPYYEEVLQRDDIDGVLIGTPDHWHAAIAIAAMKAGKDVYVEKPMSLTVAEGKAMREAEKKYGRVLQVGSQQRSLAAFRKTAELVRNGYLGEIKTVYARLGEFDPPFLKAPEPIPNGFDYDRWLGQAPYEEYFAERVAGDFQRGWRRFWDYGSRKFGDWGAHHFDIIQWALGMDDSGPVEFIPKGYNGNEYDHYIYENGVKVYRDHPETKLMIRFVGTEGEVSVKRTRGSNSLKTTPAYLATQPLSPSDEPLYFSESHHQNWFDSMKSRREAICPARIGHRSASICQIAAIARRLGRPLRWDPVNEKFVDDPAADRWLSRPRRAGYELPV